MDSRSPPSGFGKKLVSGDKFSMRRRRTQLREQTMEDTSGESLPQPPHNGLRILCIFGLLILAIVFVTPAWRVFQRSPNDDLLRALRIGNMTAAERALVQGADANLKVEQCWPSQQLSDRLSFMQYKLTNPRDYYDVPLLLAATGRGDAATVRLLLIHGADANAVMPDGMTALKLAKNSHAIDIVAVLEKAGAR